MSSTASTAPGGAPPAPNGVPLRCVGVVVWDEKGPVHVDEAGLRRGRADAAIRAARPVWVQLALPRLTRGAQSWFEGSVDPWDGTDAPELDWSAADRVLELVGAGPSTLDRHELRLLRRMPQLYGRGVARVVREVWGRNASMPTNLRFFPTVSFRPIERTDPPTFSAVRMTVGVFRNVVVTVRLPDLRWNDASEEFSYTPGDYLDVPARFFPVADDMTVDDVAEAIGLQQASTARAVSERVAATLREIERAWRHDVGSAEGLRNGDPGDARRVTEMTEHLYQLDRQLSRLLRRFELDGSAVDRRSIAWEIAMRYRFALDELRSLEGNCRLTSRAIAQAISNADQADRERFHFVVAVLGSSILVPTLVASIYGANVALPAKDSWRGFIALILFITAFALIGLFWIAKALPQKSVSDHRWLGQFPVRFGSPMIAVAAFAGGVVAVT